MSSLQCCVGVQFSGDAICLFGDGVKIREIEGCERSTLSSEKMDLEKYNETHENMEITLIRRGKILCGVKFIFIALL